MFKIIYYKGCIFEASQFYITVYDAKTLKAKSYNNDLEKIPSLEQIIGFAHCYINGEV